jgi:hypothetical protein
VVKKTNLDDGRMKGKIIFVSNLMWEASEQAVSYDSKSACFDGPKMVAPAAL